MQTHLEAPGSATREALRCAIFHVRFQTTRFKKGGEQRRRKALLARHKKNSFFINLISKVSLKKKIKIRNMLVPPHPSQLSWMFRVQSTFILEAAIS